MSKKTISQTADKIQKIVVNAGIGKLATNSANFEEKVLPDILRDLALITGQKPATKIAKQSIAGFKLREGTIVGLKVTLRGRRMSEFLDKLVKVVLPRLRDFRGIDLQNIDKNGNLSIGLREQVVFPEINPETLKVNFGLQVTIVPEFNDRTRAIEFYRQLGIPLKH